MSPAQSPIIRHFSRLLDPRQPGHNMTRHKLIDIIVIAVCCAICGIDDFEHMELWGKSRIDWLKTFLELPNGIPSHDTFNRLFAKINPKKFQECFLSWMSEITSLCKGDVVAVDGKTLRRSFDKVDAKAPIHMVSAFAAANGVVLGQVKVDDKSNEITAIPELLAALDLAGCLVTIDAMGTQREIAAQIIEADADYTMVLKENQPSLYVDVVAAFAATSKTDGATDSYSTRDAGHGRLEVRDYHIITDIADIQDKHNWPGLASIGMVKSIRVGDGKIGEESRYFLNSYTDDVKRFAQSARQHWTVENNLHWSLDVSAFSEDSCRVRKEHAPENLAVLRHISLNIHKQDPAKGSMRTKQMRCLLDHERILKLLIS
jgi:predicted transposase YbfD/YdcC